MSNEKKLSQTGNYGTTLRLELVEELLKYFGFSNIPDANLATLNRLYKSWSRYVGYDNVQKRVYFDNGGKGPFPLADPNDFVRAVLDHGTSGSCWVTAEAFFGVLYHVGFDVRRVAGQMLECNDPMKPNHGTVVVTIDNIEYAADPSMCGEEAIPLIEGKPTQAKSLAHGLWSEGNGNYWWRPGHSRVGIEYTTQFDPCTAEYFAYRYEKTKEFSLFNDILYVRRNVEEGIVSIGRGNLITVDNEGNMSAEPIDNAEIKRLLVERMGMSKDIVDRLPPDNDGETFGNVS